MSRLTHRFEPTTVPHPLVRMKACSTTGFRPASRGCWRSTSRLPTTTSCRVPRAVARLEAFTDLAKIQINRRGRQLAEQGDRSSDHVLLDEARLTGNDAKATDGRDRVCETLPEFEEALAAGACTGGHLDALAHHTKGLTDGTLTRTARSGSRSVASITSSGSPGTARRCWRTSSRCARHTTIWSTKAGGTSPSTPIGRSPG